MQFYSHTIRKHTFFTIFRLSFHNILITRSNPNAIAGRESVTKFTHKSCIGKRGVDQPKHIAANIVIISPILLESKNALLF